MVSVHSFGILTGYRMLMTIRSDLIATLCLDKTVAVGAGPALTKRRGEPDGWPAALPRHWRGCRPGHWPRAADRGAAADARAGDRHRGRAAPGDRDLAPHRHPGLAAERRLT